MRAIRLVLFCTAVAAGAGLSALRADGDEPAELVRARAEHEAARAELERGYVVELARLQDALTKSGRLDEALKVRAEREKLLAGLPRGSWPHPETDRELKLYLTGTKWRFDEGHVVTFHSTGRISKSWGKLTPAWTVSDGVISFEKRQYRLEPGTRKLVLVNEGSRDLRGDGALAD